MANKRYIRLIEDVCRICAIENTHQVKETGVLSVDGINFSLVNVGELNLATLFVVCELGRMDGTDKITMYKKMLKLNYFLASQHGPQMAIDPESEMPLLITSFLFEDITAESLIEGLRGTAQIAKSWQSGNLGIG